MGLSPFPAPGQHLPEEPPPDFIPPPLQPEAPFWRREPRLRYIVLFLLTFVSTTFAGIQGIAAPDADASWWEVLFPGLGYSIPVLAILGAHEFGHYFACVYYRVNASLPYFLPFPLFMTGTLGAVIRIRQPIRTKQALFDIGIAGPIAGFIVAVPVLIVGVAMSEVVRVPTDVVTLYFGEPLLFKFVEWCMFGTLAEGYDTVLHPVGFAAWFGLIATALNLFPIGQLDGGHISYAALGARTSTRLTIGMAVCLVGLTFISLSWILWTVLIIAMILVLGPSHPRVYDEHVPLDRTRRLLAGVALVIFILCFTPAPIDIVDLIPTGN